MSDTKNWIIGVLSVLVVGMFAFYNLSSDAAGRSTKKSFVPNTTKGTVAEAKWCLYKNGTLQGTFSDPDHNTNVQNAANAAVHLGNGWSAGACP